MSSGVVGRTVLLIKVTQRGGNEVFTSFLLQNQQETLHLLLEQDLPPVQVLIGLQEPPCTRGL